MTYQGKKVVAICLDDIGYLSVTAAVVQKAVKDGKVGMHNVAKDFVPAASTNPDVCRGSNSRSRKCTVIWLDQLPAEKLITGIDVTIMSVCGK